MIDMEDLRADFLRIYANIPLQLREGIVLILDNEPITWKVAFIEIKNNSGRAQKILEQLKKLSII
jgi:hypothetical protein